MSFWYMSFEFVSATILYNNPFSNYWIIVIRKCNFFNNVKFNLKLLLLHVSFLGTIYFLMSAIWFMMLWKRSLKGKILITLNMTGMLQRHIISNNERFLWNLMRIISLLFNNEKCIFLIFIRNFFLIQIRVYVWKRKKRLYFKRPWNLDLSKVLK